MYRLIKFIIILPLLSLNLLAQNRFDTESIIIRELKTFENDNFTIKEAAFSEGGSVFNYTTYIPNSSDDRLTFNLENVNIFTAKKVTAKGHYQYDLMVETRGKGGKIRFNGGEISGAIPLIKNVSNKNRIDALVKAFAHLKKLLGTGDSRSPFQ